MANNREHRALTVLGRWAGSLAGTLSGAVEGTVQAVRHPPPEVEPAPPRHDDTHFEHSEFNARAVLITGICVLVGMWIITGVLYFYFSFLSRNRAESTPPPLPIEQHGNPIPPEPRLQQSPPQDLKALRAREDWELNHYFWIDKAKGTIAIPIERAMQLVGERGIPPQKTPPGLVLSTPQAGTRQTGFEGKVEPEPR
jgi:hypothetical protein